MYTSFPLENYTDSQRPSNFKNKLVVKYKVAFVLCHCQDLGTSPRCHYWSQAGDMCVNMY